MPSKMIAGRNRRSVRINLWLIYTRIVDVLGWVLISESWILNEYQNGARIWSVSELYLKAESEWVPEWHPYLERIWTVSESWMRKSPCRISSAGRVDNCPRLFQVSISDLLQIVDDSHRLTDLSWRDERLVVCNVIMYEMHCRMMFSIKWMRLCCMRSCCQCHDVWMRCMGM